MKLAVVGTRTIKDFDRLRKKLDQVVKDHGVTEIVTSDAEACDEFARQYAGEHNLNLVVYEKDWEISKNQRIVDRADALLVAWDGESKGTRETLRYCVSKAKRLHSAMYVGDAGGPDSDPVLPAQS